MNLYLLSILDGLNGALTFCSVTCGLICAGAVIFGGYFSDMKDGAGIKVCSQALKRAGIGAMSFAVLAALLPSTDSLIKAYLMAEGSQIVTADSVEELLEKVDEKLDNFAGVIK